MQHRKQDRYLEGLMTLALGIGCRVQPYCLNLTGEPRKLALEDLQYGLIAKARHNPIQFPETMGNVSRKLSPSPDNDP